MMEKELIMAAKEEEITYYCDTCIGKKRKRMTIDMFIDKYESLVYKLDLINVLVHP